MDQRPRFKRKTMKYLEENLDANLCEFGLGNGFLDIIPKTQATKEKIDKLGFTKTETFVPQRTLLRK